MKTIAFTVADQNNQKYIEKLANSLHYFHPDLELRVFNGSETKDPLFFYRQKPIIANQLMSEGFELIIGLDVDQIVTGSLENVLQGDYDVGVVYNWNRVDPPVYGEIGLATIQAREYYNCGLVALRSKEFVEHWLKLCMGKHFNMMPYREQGFLNILAHYGNYDVKCFDDGFGWYGLRSKGEWSKVIMVDGNMVLPKGEDGYPEDDKLIKVLHWAGGDMPNKQNYRIHFNEEVISYLDEITNAKTKQKET